MRKNVCRKCSDHELVQSANPSLCKSCGTRFALAASITRHVFTKGDVQVSRKRRNGLLWSIEKNARTGHKELYLSCPRCSSIVKEYSRKVMIDGGTVFRYDDTCFECDACRMHFWVHLDGYDPGLGAYWKPRN